MPRAKRKTSPIRPISKTPVQRTPLLKTPMSTVKVNATTGPLPDTAMKKPVPTAAKKAPPRKPPTKKRPSRY